MRPILLSACLSWLAAASLAPRADAAPHETCVPRAVGVPTRPGPPDWWDAAPGGDPSLDDPRWNEANGQSFHLGSAEAPLHTRTLWSSAGGKDYLYVSFISDLAPTTSLARDIFLGFRRAHPDGGQYAYLFQFHLGNASVGDAQPLGYCGKYDFGGAHPCPTTASWWRMFLDSNVAGTCTDGPTGEQFTTFNGASITTPPVTWMDNSVRYWQLDGTSPLKNRWAIQARIQFATDPAWQPGHAYAVGDQVGVLDESYQCITAGTSGGAGPTGTAADITDGTAHWKHVVNPIALGMEKGSTFWYEGTENPTVGDAYASIGRFPTPNGAQTGVTTSVCVTPNLQDTVVHEELGSAPGCPACDATKFATLKAFAPLPATGCDAGLAIESGGIGARYDSALTNFDAVTPLSGINQPAVNTMIAQVKNTTGAAIDVPLMARFRLANWGTTVFTPGSTDTGVFQPIRGSESGVCAADNTGTAALCDGSFSIPAHGQKAITFPWTLNDAEKCIYGLPGPCTACVCDSANGCDPAAAPGTMGTKVTGTTACLKRRNEHQCMYVELTAPNGGVTFVQQSAYNNMQFGGMSELAREALVDARQLPTVPGQAFQDIYLMVMPRNMPASVPPTTTTVALVQDAALASALRIAQPYIDDLARLPPEQLAAIVARTGRPQLAIRVPPKDDRIRKIVQALQVMPDADARRVAGLVVLATREATGDRPSATQVADVVSTVGPEAAGAIVPTLDIYPFYRPGDRGRRYAAMTAFTVFLSHESTLSGMHYEIDGADRVSDNVYHLRIPVGNARKIQVRAQAVTGGEAVLAGGNAAWPCTGGCACGGGAQRRCGLVAIAGNTTPGLFAGVLVIRRRKKRRA